MIPKIIFTGAIAGFLSLACFSAHAQGISINTSGTPADTSAMLDVASTSKGVLVPRMSNSQRGGIVTPANGLLIYQTDGTPGFYYNSGTTTVPVWTALGGGSGTVTSVTAGTGLSGGTITTTGTISMPNVGSAATYGSATQVPVFITDAQGRVSSVTPTTITGLPVTSLAASGTFPAENGSALTSLNGSNISSGTIAATVGGTGNTSYTIGDILYASSTSALSKLAAGASGKVLTSGGAGVAPSWQTVSGGNSIYFNSTSGGNGINGFATVYGSLNQGVSSVAAPYPLNATNGSYTIVSQACTIDAFYMTGVCRLAGTTSNNTFTVSLYVNSSATSLGSFSISGLGTVGAAVTPISVTGLSVSVSVGDIVYLRWDQTNPSTGPLPNVGWSVHAH